MIESKIRKPSYKTPNGAAYLGDSRELLADLVDDSINLVITSPPSHCNGSRPTEIKIKRITWIG